MDSDLAPLRHHGRAAQCAASATASHLDPGPCDVLGQYLSRCDHRRQIAISRLSALNATLG
jgi:hypothetical protein